MEQIKKEISEYSEGEVLRILSKNVDGLFIIDYTNNAYQALRRNDFLKNIFNETGTYDELIRKLILRFSDSQNDIADDYHVFIPMLNKFKGNYSKHVDFFYKDQTGHYMMLINPMENTDKYILVLYELDNSEYAQKMYTSEKEKTIQSTYLFSMCVDLIKDTTSSISITEISDKPVSSMDISYSQWRMMIVNMIYPDDRPIFLAYTEPEFLKTSLTTKRSISFDCQMQNLNGNYIWVKIIFSKIHSYNEEDCKFVYTVQDIHESSMKLIEDLKKYEALSITDSLTGIFNHGKIEDELHSMMKLQNTEKKPLSLIMFDIDYFKKINDRFGHATGDAVLRTLSEIANKLLSEYNITLGRWGGEEFMGLCYDTDLESAVKIAENLKDTIASYEFDTVGNITCSIGVTEVVSKKETPREAFDRVDSALYKAKANGRNCVCTD